MDAVRRMTLGLMAAGVLVGPLSTRPVAPS